MLRLLLLRHAEAVPSAGEGDVNRRLTADGEDAARRVGAYLAEIGALPDFALVSPARRTLQTLERLQEGADRPFPRLVAPTLYDAAAAAVQALVEDAPAGVASLLLVGHNPGLAEAAVAFAAFGEAAALRRLRSQFPAPALALIDFDSRNWREAARSVGRLGLFLTLASKELQIRPQEAAPRRAPS
ncbi:SixA phosphatase family protein [Methylocella sp.]|uniref:SixA phosphatase family protein n=1 Tax=Methylocella sp. TaxID=1978226 RepID=UPI003782D98F